MQEIYHIFYDISKKLTLEEHAARLEKVQDCVELTPHFAKVECKYPIIIGRTWFHLLVGENSLYQKGNEQ